MEDLSYIGKLREDVERCVKCGLCASVCPVYRIRRLEPLLARGRNVLSAELLSGREIDWRVLGKRLSLCLCCNLCGENCPTGSRGGLVTLALRGEAVKRVGLPLWKRLLYRFILLDRRTFGMSLRVLSWLQALFPRRTHPLRHLPQYLESLTKAPRIPKLASRPLREILPEVTPARGRRIMRVAIFSGCAIEYLFPQVAKKAADLLSRFGVEVLLPRGQSCCGMPLIGGGDMEGARRLARKNLRALLGADVDYVVVLCATCGSALRELYPEFLLEESSELSSKTKDISEFIADILKPDSLQTSLPPGTRLTYHDPCHLAHHLGIVRQPREILRGLKGVEFIEMEEADSCCGMGGVFSFEHPDISREIAEQKIRRIESSRAQVVVTACPGCMIQLMDQIRRREMSQVVLHLVEVLQ